MHGTCSFQEIKSEQEVKTIVQALSQTVRQIEHYINTETDA